MAKDLIIGAITDYKYKDIEPWVNSIDQSGFEGLKAVIAYNCDKQTIDLLTEKKFTIFGFQKDDKENLIYNYNPRFNIVVERFAHLWHFLSQVDDVRYVIATDVKDVIFQTNPSKNIEEQMVFGKKKLLVGAENFFFKDEPWNINNMTHAYGPTIFSKLRDSPIYCAGVIAGELQAFSDLCLNLFLLCRGTDAHVPGGGGPDQASLNVLLSLEPYKSITKFTNPNEDYICHLGTTLPAILSGSGEIGFSYKRDNSLLDKYKHDMLYLPTKIKDDLVCNDDGEPYSIVHQYDRVDGLKEKILKKYGVTK